MSSARKALTYSATGLVLLVTLCKLGLHLYDGRSYGFFVDELYYMACARHLDWGYVDQPPLIAGIAWLVMHVLGDSLPALRFLPAVAVLTAPGILGLDNFFSMNAFEPVIWMACAWLVIRILKSGNQRLWIWFGLLAGLGLENKYSILIFGGGIVVGLLLTPQRRQIASPWFWIAGLLAFLLFVPNLLWNLQHHFPFVELQQNLRRSGRDVARVTHPYSMPYQHFDVFYCQDLKPPLPVLWPQLKRWN